MVATTSLMSTPLLLLSSLQQNKPGQPQQQLLLMLHDDKMGYCNLDGALKLKKRKRQPTDEPRPAKVSSRILRWSSLLVLLDKLAFVCCMLVFACACWSSLCFRLHHVHKRCRRCWGSSPLLVLLLLQAVVEHRDYYDNEIAERQDRVAAIDIDPAAVDLEGEGDLDAAEFFGGDGEEGYQDDAEGAEQGGLGYQ
jgi:hypothetical protein